MDNDYQRLARFIRDEMRMSHVYQPVMLKVLLESTGKASVSEIAEALLLHDVSQREYYEQIVKQMVGRVLTKNRGITERAGSSYHLKGFDALAPSERASLISFCDEKIDDYIARRGSAIWSHRRRSSQPLSGTLRYEVLKRARHRCELCGISAEEKALEVDHILPRNHGGSDELINLQALCYSCNAMKRDRDDTDFRGVSELYSERDETCPFCSLPAGRVMFENELALAFEDAFPVTEGHLLVIPKRHVADFFDVFQPERNAMQALLEKGRGAIAQRYADVTGFNIGINAGKDAGQTIFHCHMHLIPRRKGDATDPRGGVRGVIPAKQRY